MIRIFHVYFASRTLLLAVSEALLIVLALIAAMFAVLGADAGLALQYEYELVKILLATLICMLCMHYYDLYDSMILHSPAQAAVRVVQVLGSSCVILACLYYVYPGVQINQNLLMSWVVLAGISLIVWRRLFLAFNRSARRSQKTLLLGTGPLASQLADEIESRPELGLDLAGYVDLEPASNGQLHQHAYLGDTGELEALLERHKIQRVIVAMEAQRGRSLVGPLLAAKARGVIVDDGPEFYEAVAARVDLNSLRASMLLFYEGFRFRPLVRLYKRAASLLLSSIGMLLALPLMIAIAIAIRLESSGPIIFRQRRIGKDGKPFTLYKFRSMYDRADRGGQSRPAQLNDGRCTRIGRWLRRTRLDELPQLYNILRGDMHFIGPRPFAVDEEEYLSRQIPFYSNRWAVRPGATGWAQVRRGYNETIEDNVEKLAYDLYYIKHLSFGLDLLILLETAKIVLLGRGGR
jgi:exopolysaccharide biosynthesis polyprenyl glycosylphosphotransferase